VYNHTSVIKNTIKNRADLTSFSLPTARDPVHTGARAREIFCDDWIVMLLSGMNTNEQQRNQRTLSER